MDLGIYFTFDYQLHTHSFHGVTTIVLSIRASESNSHQICFPGLDGLFSCSSTGILKYEKLTLDRS